METRWREKVFALKDPRNLRKASVKARSHRRWPIGCRQPHRRDGKTATSMNAGALTEQLNGQLAQRQRQNATQTIQPPVGCLLIVIENAHRCESLLPPDNGFKNVHQAADMCRCAPIGGGLFPSSSTHLHP